MRALVRTPFQVADSSSLAVLTGSGAGVVRELPRALS